MVTLNSIFCSNMIMQANMPVRFFGNGQGNVKITFNGVTKEAASTDQWLIEFDSVSYGGPYDILVNLDSSFFTLRNVYFGDVYLLGGQSNMQFKLKESSEPVESFVSACVSGLTSISQPSSLRILAAFSKIA